MAFDDSTFEKAYAEALGPHVDHHNEQTSALGLTAIDIGSIQTAFCTTWPKVKGTILAAIGIYAFFMPAQAAQVKAFITAFEATVLPAVCPAP